MNLYTLAGMFESARKTKNLLCSHRTLAEFQLKLIMIGHDDDRALELMRTLENLGDHLHAAGTEEILSAKVTP